ncbi:carboxypeptidase B-like [Hydractinia symbiolongicarpus]|uniref:carboxypeptidase B-like n=1 Tax=Hydractinia symbiolongicarpus TaxID=13093 RepID=UPI00254E0C43|nr:carboxypeptidase B-like [Hydractinia symbiolongicarpus]
MWKFLALLLVAAAHGKNEFSGDKVLRITPTTENQVKYLKEWISLTPLELDVWREPGAAGNPVDIHIKAYDLGSVKSMLKEKDISFKVMMNDVGDAVEEERLSNQKNAFFSGFDYNQYNTYENIKQELRSLANRYSEKASTFSVGRSYEGEEMLGIKITDGNSGSKPVVWIDGGIHAREWISPATVMYFTKELLTSSRSDVSDALSKYEFYILPVFNVDGYKYTHTGGRARMWRKTRSRSGNGWCVGADPNRNWDHKFGGVGTSSNPCQDTYHGTSAFSEIEVRQVANYLRRLNLKSYWNVHAYSQLVLTPWSYTTRLPADYGEIKRVADIFVNAVSRRYRTYYRAGPPSRILYAVAGGSIDWVYAELGVKYSYALELRDRGSYGFVLPARYIKPSGEETTDAFLAAINAMK